MFKNIIAAILLIVTFYGCQKGISSEINSPVTPPTGTITDTTLMTKYVELTGPAFTDTQVLLTCTYDNLKRISKTFNIKSNPPFIEHTFTTTRFVYNGSDTLPLKVFLTYAGDYGTYENDTAWFTYNAARQLVKDSVCSDSIIWRQKFLYQYPGNGVIETRIPVVGATEVTQVIATYLNNDRVTEKDTYTYFSADNSYTFDTHPNPIYKTIVRYPFYRTHYTQYDPQPNNVTEEIVSLSDNTGNMSRNDLQYSYIYRSDGYPLSSIRHNLLYLPANQIKSIYYYQ